MMKPQHHDRIAVLSPPLAAPRKSLRLLATAWREQLDTLQGELRAIKIGNDAEALHRFRVALRKTRALLKLFAIYLPDAAKFDDEFGWIAALTSPLRDGDILLQDAHALALQAALPALIAEIEDDRSTALAQLADALASRRFALLIMQWRTYIAELPARKIAARAKLMRNQLFLNELVLTQTYELLKRSLRARHNNVSSRALHKLRIRAKRLRYVIESFPQLSADTHARALHKRLQQLQTILGEHQDNAMISARLRRAQETTAQHHHRKLSSPEDHPVQRDDKDETTARQALQHWQHLAEQRRNLARVRYRRAIVKLAAASEHLSI